MSEMYFLFERMNTFHEPYDMLNFNCHNTYVINHTPTMYNNKLNSEICLYKWILKQNSKNMHVTVIFHEYKLFHRVQKVKIMDKT